MALIGKIAPVLVWLRDHKGVPLNIDVIRFSIELRWMWKLAMQKIYVLRDADTGKETEINVNGEIPEEIIWPLKAYLGELPGYDPTMPLDKQKGDEPSKQNGFAQFYFTATFTQLAVSLGHIFDARWARSTCAISFSIAASWWSIYQRWKTPTPRWPR